MTADHCLLGRNAALENIITTWHPTRAIASAHGDRLCADYPDLTFIVISPKEARS